MSKVSQLRLDKKPVQKGTREEGVKEEELLILAGDAEPGKPCCAAFKFQNLTSSKK